MKYKGTLIVVKNAKESLKFYHDLFGLDLLHDNDGNMELSEGIYLQEEKYWNQFLNKKIIPFNNASELYFEEDNLEEFAKKLELLYPQVKYANKLMTHSWGQKVVRFYDLDGNLIEVGSKLISYTEDP